MSAYADVEFCRVVYISRASELILTMSNGILEFVSQVISPCMSHACYLCIVFSFGLGSNSWLEDFFFFNNYCRYEDANHYDKRAPHAKKAHPRPDHFYPLHVATGAIGVNAKAKLIHHS